MAASIPTAGDFFHPKFNEFINSIFHPFILQRKLWEFAFIAEALGETGIITDGSRGLVFGCGSEPLPALFASRGCTIVATDAPPGTSSLDWSQGGQHATEVNALRRPYMISDDEFSERVTFEFCDMNAIGPHLKGFDFVWSACCLEHLGSLRCGLDFILNSVDTLKPGGFACHTTEFNLSSNSETFESENLSLFRKRDVEGLLGELAQRGHRLVRPFIVPLGATPLDYHVDLPPYGGKVHLKLEIEKYVCTSLGLLIQRGQ